MQQYILFPQGYPFMGGKQTMPADYPTTEKLVEVINMQACTIKRV